MTAEAYLANIDHKAGGEVRIWRQGPTWFAKHEPGGQEGHGSSPMLALHSLWFTIEADKGGRA